MTDEIVKSRIGKNMLEDDASVMICLAPDFPSDDVTAILSILEASKSLVPGFIPAPAGFLRLEAISYAALAERVQTVVMPDRNIVSRMAAIARSGMPQQVDSTTRLAAQVMALCQSVDFDIEPSVAFHELAHRQGNDAALEEPAWFRVADENRFRDWIDIALGRTSRLPTISPKVEPFADLAAPLPRWERNYAVALKIGSLELSPQSRIAKARALIEWMISDFIVAGPAAIFATMYLSPRAAKARMMKQLRSEHRNRALDGMRNAAWDITYLSEFVRRVRSADYDSRRFVLATGDRALAELGGLMFQDAETHADFQHILRESFEPWWGSDAPQVARLVSEAIQIAEAREAPTSASHDYVGDVIAAGERHIRNWG